MWKGEHNEAAQEIIRRIESGERPVSSKQHSLGTVSAKDLVDAGIDFKGIHPNDVVERAVKDFTELSFTDKDISSWFEATAEAMQAEQGTKESPSLTEASKDAVIASQELATEDNTPSTTIDR